MRSTSSRHDEAVEGDILKSDQQDCGCGIFFRCLRFISLTDGGRERRDLLTSIGAAC